MCKTNLQHEGETLREYPSLYLYYFSRSLVIIIHKIKWGVIGSGSIARRRTIPEEIKQTEYTKRVSVYDLDSEVNNDFALRS